MTDEDTRRTDRAASLAVLVLLAISVVGFGLWWFVFRNQPDNPPNPPTPTATQIIIDFPDTPTSTSTTQPTITPTITPTATESPTKQATSTPTISPSPFKTPTPVATATPDDCAGVRGRDIYQIRRGDTLWFIAGCLGNSFDYPRLAELNGLDNPHLIHAGNWLRLR